MLHYAAILLVALVDWWMPDTARIVFVGDAMQHGPQIVSAQRNGGSFDYSPCFSLVKSKIESADYAVVNLECPLGGAPYSGYPAFSAPDDYARELKSIGFDLFTTANNHCMDRGPKGLRRTIDVLDEMCVPHIGTYKSKEERKTRAIYRAEIKGVRVAFLTYTYGTNGIPVTGGVNVSLIDKQAMAEEIAEARKKSDLVCVCMHWGEEYHLLPTAEQESLADFLVDQGVDMIIGSHPHVIEPMERRFSFKWGKEVLLVYSLGNFISNQNGDDSRGGAMLDVEIVRNPMEPWKITFGNVGYRLFFCQKPVNASVKSDSYLLVPVEVDTETNVLIAPKSLKARSREAYDKFVRRAMEIFNKYNVKIPMLAW